MKDEYTLAVSGVTHPPKPSSRIAKTLYIEAAKAVVDDWGPPTYLMSGCAFGIDTDAIMAFLKIFPAIKRVYLVVPGAPYNVAWVNECLGIHSPMERTAVTVHRMPVRTQPIAKAYMARNDYVAEHADKLVAFPHQAEEQLRSGTWATVRRFEKLDKPVIVRPTAEVIDGLQSRE